MQYAQKNNDHISTIQSHHTTLNSIYGYASIESPQSSNTIEYHHTWFDQHSITPAAKQEIMKDIR